MQQAMIMVLASMLGGVRLVVARMPAYMLRYLHSPDDKVRGLICYSLA